VKFELIIKRGAVIDDLREETLELIGKYKNVDRTIILKIACGINEFTTKPTYCPISLDICINHYHQL
jgi:septum formation topological specificity factor MinE